MSEHCHVYKFEREKQENFFFFCFSEPLTTLHTSSMPPWIYTLSRKTPSFPDPHPLKFFSLIFCYFFLTILSLLSGFLSAVEWTGLDTVLQIRTDADKRNSIAISCCSPQTYPVHYRELISSFPPRLLPCMIMKSKTSRLSYLGVPRKQALAAARMAWGIVFNVSWLKQWPMLPWTHSGSGSSGPVPHKPVRIFSISCRELLGEERERNVRHVPSSAPAGADCDKKWT